MDYVFVDIFWSTQFGEMYLEKVPENTVKERKNKASTLNWDKTMTGKERRLFSEIGSVFKGNVATPFKLGRFLKQQIVTGKGFVVLTCDLKGCTTRLRGGNMFWIFPCLFPRLLTTLEYLNCLTGRCKYDGFVSSLEEPNPLTHWVRFV